MPFTVSHIAAVAWVRSRWLSYSALVAGAIAPDFSYVVFRGHYAHNLAGLFYFCIPAALLAFYSFHFLMKEPLLALAPPAPRRRLARVFSDHSNFAVVETLKVFAAVHVGSATHLLWDSFTHDGGYLVVLLPEMRRALFTTPFGTTSVYRFLQHASTVVGLAIVARIAIVRYDEIDPRGWRTALREFLTSRAFAWAGGVLAAIVIAAAIVGWSRYDVLADFTVFPRFLVRSIKFGMGLTLGVMAAYSVAWHVARKARRAGIVKPTPPRDAEPRESEL
jgi:hypothetical protein